MRKLIEGVILSATMILTFGIVGALTRGEEEVVTIVVPRKSAAELEADRIAHKTHIQVMQEEADRTRNRAKRRQQAADDKAWASLNELTSDPDTCAWKGGQIVSVNGMLVCGVSE